MAQALGKTATRLGSMALRSAAANNYIQHRTFMLPFNVRNWLFNLSGYNQYGLYRHDLLMENEVVTEAIRRLPPQVQDEREFRLQRATQCSLTHSVLPKDQWPTYEEDLEKGRYLEKLIADIEKEKAEQSSWFNQ